MTPILREEAVRRALIEYVREQSRWRSQKADEYPDDRRNLTSSAALEMLARHIEGLPDQDKRFERLAELGDVLFPGGDVFLPGEEAARTIARFGFDRPPVWATPEWVPDEVAFFDELVQICEEEAGRFQLEALDEAATSEGALDALDDFEGSGT